MSPRQLLPLLTALACLGLAGGPAAADPMRPLAVPGKQPPAGVATTAPAAPRSSDATKPTGRLIAIRQDSRGQRQALIGERWVAVGDRVDDHVVAAIGANQVDLVDRTKPAGQAGKTRSTLHLLPPLQASTETQAATTHVAEVDRGNGDRRAGSPPR